MRIGVPSFPTQGQQSFVTLTFGLDGRVGKDCIRYVWVDNLVSKPGKGGFFFSSFNDQNHLLHPRNFLWSARLKSRISNYPLDLQLNAWENS